MGVHLIDTDDVKVRGMANGTNLVVVRSLADLPASVAGVKTLLAGVTYFISTEIDLLGDRIVCGANTVITGGSSENCRLKSTGLVGTALITSEWSLPMRFITIEADIALNLDATANPNQALDWLGVNFTDCGTVGTIKNYSNFIMSDSALLNSQGMTFDGTIGTVGLASCLFDCSAGGTALVFPATLTISRRFRTIYSSFVVLAGETGISFNAGVTVPAQGYILDFVNFAGGGTYTSGVTYSDTKARFSECRGIDNSGNIAQYYMNGNATATVVVSDSTFYKVAGTTSSGAFVEKFDVTGASNRAVYQGALKGFYKVTAIATLSSGNNHQVAFRVAVDGTTSAQSESRTTTNGSGKSENMICSDIVLLSNANYVEIFVANYTSATDVTVEDLNVIIERLN